ncbi:MAG: hypothetical protein KKA63_07275 [Gammaproteobacteria bacterium]|nr:hypothetical protein [Gammaproteobacteria bacterium]
MQKFDFSIRTRDGQRIVSVVIAGRDQQEAERKLNQMYRYCEVLTCEIRKQDDHRPQQAISVEDIITLISK